MSIPLEIRSVATSTLNTPVLNLLRASVLEFCDFLLWIAAAVTQFFLSFVETLSAFLVPDTKTRTCFRSFSFIKGF